MFRGRYEHVIDAKGRTSVPSRFREALGALGDSRLVVTTGLDECVIVYPMSEWLSFEERLAALPQFDANVRMLKRIYVSGAVECDVDKAGRILIPASLRKHAGLKRDALWAGMGRHIELWSTEAFEDLRKRVLKDDTQIEQMMQHLAELGL